MKMSLFGLILATTLIISESIMFPSLAQTDSERSRESEVELGGADHASKQAEADRLFNEGLRFWSLTQWPEALEQWEQALFLFQEVDDSEGETNAIASIGLISAAFGDYDQALAYFQEALVIAREFGYRLEEGIILNAIGQTYNHLSDSSQALENLQQALEIIRDLSAPQGEGVILSNIGFTHMNLGDYPQALNYFQDALVILEQSDAWAERGVTLGNIGFAYDRLGDYPKALSFYEEALVILRASGNRIIEGNTLNNIGLAHFHMGDYSQSLIYYQQALDIFDDLNAPGKNMTFTNIGTVYRVLGNFSQALIYYQQSLDIARTFGERVGEATALHNIGEMYHSLGNLSQALVSYQQSLDIFREVDHRAGEGFALGSIGALYQSKNNYSDAEQKLEEAILILESLRDTDLDDSTKITFLDTQWQFYNILQSILISQNKNSSALAVSERSRSRAMVELLTEKASDRLEQKLITEAPNIGEIQRIIQQQNATLVNYSIIYSVTGEVSLYIWVIQPDGTINFVEQPLEDADSTSTFQNPIAQLNGAFYRGVSQPDTTTTQVADLRSALRAIGLEWDEGAAPSDRLKEFHKLLIDPIAQYLPTDPEEKVIFIPQGGLFLVPFAALQDEDGIYLIEKHTILTAPSIQVLGLTHDLRPPLGSNNPSALKSEDLLIVGNPTMPSVPTRPGDSEIILDSLSGAEGEAKAIASLFNTTPLIGRSATETAVTQKLSTAKVVHLATHGLLDYGQVQVSGIRDVPGAIALAPDAQADGLLTSAEILDLELNADLVVLSACDTGRGDIRGDGVIGLSRSLITAGVPSIVVSLWQVPDTPTANLMTEFYRQLQQHPDKAQALRQAMLTTMQNHPHPSNWAGFTLIGQP